VGVLLVHGIGDHQEGETLTSFGEPLLDWMRDWLKGPSDKEQRGSLEVVQARLKATRTEAESPAFALARIDVARDNVHAGGTETWLVAEAWWGDAVLPPPTLKLMGWVWTRAPLIIYWHFYLASTARGDREATLQDNASALLAFLLAAFTQLVVALAILLWVVPIGRWRRAIGAAMRVLTLTLGDSYVLLEHDAQRAALVERVRRCLAWLAEHADRVAVIAHSQGGAIAHAALRAADPRARVFISVGSGLEKLHFLRRARETRSGLGTAALLVPLVAAGAALLFAGIGDGRRALIALGVVTLFAALVLAAVLVAALERYKRYLGELSGTLSLSTPGHRTRWTDIHATRDVVPMGGGSLLNRWRFVRRQASRNESSFLHDHVRYFANRNDCLPRIWLALAGLSRLRLLRAPERARLARFARLHAWSCTVLALSHLALWAAGLLGLIALRDKLVAFGASVLDAAANAPFAATLFKWLNSLAAFVGWAIEGLLPAGAVDAEALAPALFGAAVLLAGLITWWIAFKSFWRLRCAARWRRAAGGGDVLSTPLERVRAAIGSVTLAAAGSMPLLVLGLASWAPEALSITLISNLLAASLAVLCVVVATLAAGVSPWAAHEAWRNTAARASTRIAAPFGAVIGVVMILVAAQFLWPFEIPPWVPSFITASAALSIVLSWQIYVLLRLRAALGAKWLTAILVAPPGAAIVASFGAPPAGSVSSVALVYAATGAAVLISCAIVIHRQEFWRIAVSEWNRRWGRER
jgi:hypothetical protein